MAVPKQTGFCCWLDGGCLLFFARNISGSPRVFPAGATQIRATTPMLEIAVGPPHIATNQGHTVLVTEPDGQIPLHSRKGLFFRDTRLVSGWSICANGASW